MHNTRGAEDKERARARQVLCKRYLASCRSDPSIGGHSNKLFFVIAARVEISNDFVRISADCPRETGVFVAFIDDNRRDDGEEEVELQALTLCFLKSDFSTNWRSGHAWWYFIQLAAQFLSGCAQAERDRRMYSKSEKVSIRAVNPIRAVYYIHIPKYIATEFSLNLYSYNYGFHRQLMNEARTYLGLLKGFEARARDAYFQHWNVGLKLKSILGNNQSYNSNSSNLSNWWMNRRATFEIIWNPKRDEIRVIWFQLLSEQRETLILKYWLIIVSLKIHSAWSINSN